METSNSIRFAGQTVTLSFWARKGANYSPTSSALKSYITTGTGTDQNGLSGFTGGVDYIQTNTLTTTWQRFTQTQTLNSTVTQVAIQFIMSPTGTAGANDYFEITGIQLDLGSVALPFRRAGGTIAGELAACQRYYYRNTTGKNYGTLGWANAYSTTATRGVVNFPVGMRVVPTSVDSGNLTLQLWAVAEYAFTGLTLIGDNSTPYTAVFETTGSTGLTAQRTYTLVSNNNTAGYIGFSAEL